MKNFIFISIISMTLSCNSIKMSIDVPANIDDEFSLVRVSGVKGKMLPGASRTLEFEKEFIGNFKDGWKVSSDKYDKTPGGMFSKYFNSNFTTKSINFKINKNEKQENEVSFNGIRIDYSIFYQFLFK